METLRITDYGPIVRAALVPPAPPAPVRSTSPVAQALTIVGIVVGIGTSVMATMVSVASVALRDVDLSAVSAPGAPTTPGAPTAPIPSAAPSDLFVEHDGDDCAAAALRTSHECQDVQCFTAASTDLRACLARPEQEARLCGELPDASNAAATAQWIDARCSFEETRDYSDCVRMMSVVTDHCAVLGAEARL